MSFRSGMRLIISLFSLSKILVSSNRMMDPLFLPNEMITTSSFSQNHSHNTKPGHSNLLELIAFWSDLLMEGFFQWTRSWIQEHQLSHYLLLIQNFQQHIGTSNQLGPVSSSFILLQTVQSCVLTLAWYPLGFELRSVGGHKTFHIGCTFSWIDTYSYD